MSAPHRRGACPGLSAPMLTGDGLLVRLTPVAAIAPDRFAAFCSAASRDGNGTIEITARGSFQVRGLTPQSASTFADEISTLEIAADGVTLLTNPLAGEAAAEFDEAGFADALREAVSKARLALAPKISVVVDNGDGLHLDALSADLRLRAVSTPGGVMIHVAVGGDAASAIALGAVVPAEAGAAALALLKVIAARGAVRAADILKSEGAGVFADAVAGKLMAFAPPSRAAAEPVARHRARDGKVAVGVALEFGHAHADALSELAATVFSCGATGLRPALGRALLVIGLSEDGADHITAAAERLGFIVRADDPRRRIVACPGAPACASGLIPARVLAAQLAEGLPRLPRDTIVHISGCAKGCAHPAPTTLTLVGTDDGCGLVRDGTARAAPERIVDAAHLPDIVARLADPEREAAYG
ncbi:MAG: precorrin-3B synthase [Pseudolabrys sp.]